MLFCFSDTDTLSLDNNILSATLAVLITMCSLQDVSQSSGPELSDNDESDSTQMDDCPFENDTDTENNVGLVDHMKYCQEEEEEEQDRKLMEQMGLPLSFHKSYTRKVSHFSVLCCRTSESAGS